MECASPEIWSRKGSHVAEDPIHVLSSIQQQNESGDACFVTLAENILTAVSLTGFLLQE